MSLSDLAQRRILLGISGGIAAYKAAELVRRLRERGAEVRVVMTASAREFVSPLTFQALSGSQVRESLWDSQAEAAMGHIELARWAEVVLIAPASANTLARIANGLADDLLTTLCLATAAPVCVAPAMNMQMWANPATAHNLATLRARGVRVLGPASGDQACGEFGAGRLLEPAELVQQLRSVLAPQRLAGRRILISAGPTYEDIDPVRFLGNRSSGRMGFALAEEATAMGATVTLVAGPVSLPTPQGVIRHNVRCARDMHAAVLAESEHADVFIAAAAVADFRVEQVSPHKIKKGGEPPVLKLVQNPDILADVAGRARRPFLVGFAAETHDVEHYARGKLERKGLDMIAANDVTEAGCGFETESNSLLVLWPGGSHRIAKADKHDVARGLLILLAERLDGGVAHAR